jgi:hypothetical protein
MGPAACHGAAYYASCLCNMVSSHKSRLFAGGEMEAMAESGG